jgi:cation transport ATPase
MLFTFVTLGKFLESYAKGKTTSALKSLMELQPCNACRIKPCDANVPMEERFNDFTCLETEDVASNQIREGDYLLVQPGARIPADGTLVAISARKNASSVSASVEKDQKSGAFIDESALSGEPFPVAKSLGSVLYGATVNQLTPLIMKVTAAGESTVLSHIVRLVEDAQRHKAPIEAYADRIASIFAPTVVILSVITFLCWLGLHNGSPKECFYLALMSAISVVVVACPCALG